MKHSPYLAFFAILYSLFDPICAAQNPQTPRSAFSRSFYKTPIETIEIKKSPCAFLYTQHLAGNLKSEIHEIPWGKFAGIPASYEGFCMVYDSDTWNPTENKLIYKNKTTSLSFPTSQEGLTQIIISFDSGRIKMDDTNQISHWFERLISSNTPHEILEKLFQQCTLEEKEKILNPQEFDPKDDPQGLKTTEPPLLNAFFRFKKERSVDSIKLCHFITNSGANPFRKYHGHTKPLPSLDLDPLPEIHLQRPYLTEYLTDEELATIYEPTCKKQLIQARWLFNCLKHPQQDDPNGPAFERGVDADPALLIIQYCFGLKNNPKAARLFQEFIDQPIKAETEEAIPEEIIL